MRYKKFQPAYTYSISYMFTGTKLQIDNSSYMQEMHKLCTIFCKVCRGATKLKTASVAVSTIYKRLYAVECNRKTGILKMFCFHIKDSKYFSQNANYALVFQDRNNTF